jgi:tetratricopeptide (TPR) repeat protein
MRSVLLALLLAACSSSRGGPRLGDAPFARRLLGLAAELRIDDADPTAAAQSLEGLARSARTALERGGTEPPVDVLNRVVFDEEAFRREVDDTDLAYVLLPSVLRGRRGSCVGLGTLYLALGELLTIPMQGVAVPGHFFVRAHEGGGARNVELLRRGQVESTAWYSERWPLPDTTVPIYDRPLTDDEVVGIVEYDVGNELRRHGRITDARRAFERAVADFPSLPEARASLGAVLQLTGDLDKAAAAYATAEQLEPRLPGLDRNLRLLNDERRLAARASPFLKSQ